MKELQVRGKRCRTQLTLEPRVHPFPPTLTSTFSTSTSSPQHSLNYSKSRSWRQPRTQAILPPQCPICALTARMAPTLLHSHSRLQVLSGASHILSLPCPSAWPALCSVPFKWSLLALPATFSSEQLLNAGLCCWAPVLRCSWAFSCAESRGTWQQLLASLVVQRLK